MTDWNASLFTKLYSKLSLALGVTPHDEDAPGVDGPLPARYPVSVPDPNGGEPQFLLAILNPGQYIPADMDPATNAEDRYALSVLFNSVPQFSWVYKPAASTISNTYHSILEYKETPEVHLTPEQKKSLEDSITTVEKYEADYEKYQEAYWTVLDQYDEAYASWVNGGKPIPRALSEKLNAAKDKWVRSGHRSAVESATAVIARYEALEPETFWYKLLERYDTGTDYGDRASPYQIVGMSPPYKSWFGDDGWTSFSFDQKDMDNQTESQVIGVSGNLDGEFGIFKISGDVNYDKESSYLRIDQTELKFSCKLMRITFDRPWMNPLVLSSRAWRWAPGTPTYDSKLSSGADIFSDVPPKGVMTVIPTAAILSKDLAVQGSFEKRVVDKLNDDISAQASVGIGPFSVAGRFNLADRKDGEKGTIATNGITAEDVQLIAYVCEVLPECPNPDPTLKWPNP